VDGVVCRAGRHCWPHELATARLHRRRLADNRPCGTVANRPASGEQLLVVHFWDHMAVDERSDNVDGLVCRCYSCDNAYQGQQAPRVGER
jgi:hypothetical protein